MELNATSKIPVEDSNNQFHDFITNNVFRALMEQVRWKGCEIINVTATKRARTKTNGSTERHKLRCGHFMIFKICKLIRLDNVYVCFEWTIFLTLDTVN
jgi:hypothetical protein